MRCSRERILNVELCFRRSSENAPRNVRDRSSCDSDPQCVELLCLQARSTLRLLDRVLQTLESRSATSKRSPDSAAQGTSQVVHAPLRGVDARGAKVSLFNTYTNNYTTI